MAAPAPLQIWPIKYPETFLLRHSIYEEHVTNNMELGLIVILILMLHVRPLDHWNSSWMYIYRSTHKSNPLTMAAMESDP